MGVYGDKPSVAAGRTDSFFSQGPNQLTEPVSPDADVGICKSQHLDAVRNVGVGVEEVVDFLRARA